MNTGARIQTAFLFQFAQEFSDTIRLFRLTGHVDESLQLFNTHENSAKFSRKSLLPSALYAAIDCTHFCPLIFLANVFSSDLLNRSYSSRTARTCSGFDKFGTCKIAVNADNISMSSITCLEMEHLTFAHVLLCKQNISIPSTASA